MIESQWERLAKCSWCQKYEQKKLSLCPVYFKYVWKYLIVTQTIFYDVLCERYEQTTSNVLFYNCELQIDGT